MRQPIQAFSISGGNARSRFPVLTSFTLLINVKIRRVEWFKLYTTVPRGRDCNTRFWAPDSQFSTAVILLRKQILNQWNSLPLHNPFTNKKHLILYDAYKFGTIFTYYLSYSFSSDE
jgi:hypothetical protein